MECGLAIASVSIQLIDSISAIKKFIQNVKDAPKESHRIVDLLERLGDLIEGVRDMTERQAMLRGHQLPAPSPLILRCLKSCETTLQPLQDLADKYQRSQAQKSSPITKLRGDLKLAWKSKDIVAMETRIQQEIQYLTSTLVLNSTSILFQVPAMFTAHRQVEPQALAISTCEEVVEKTSLISSSDDVHSFERTAVTASRSLERNTVTTTRSLQRTAITTTTRSSWVPSYFERFGLRQQKLLRILSIAEDQSSTDANEQVISEQDIYTWASSYLGHGISLTRNRVYGGILPSLATYPVVETFFTDFSFCSVGDFQRKITSGEIHPYARDEAGRSLLHLNRKPPTITGWIYASYSYLTGYSQTSREGASLHSTTHYSCGVKSIVQSSSVSSYKKRMTFEL
ncbi:hypothetical protein IQ07DRAFT_419100 [Pyrenochaeta sp. DS3sAY3a]|nr:hypothetical protein IQ07DRAFT_419100 [Pyrenochaeta sp. DS3sAY3a]